MTDLGERYGETRQRLVGLLTTLDDGDWTTPVAATPGWQVRDVVGHLVAICDDALAGRLAGPPPEEVTAQQVQRMRPIPPPELLARWDELAPPFQELLTAVKVWPAVIDIWSHEQDIRTAVGQPGGRDLPLVREMAKIGISVLDIEGRLTVELNDDDAIASPDKPGPKYRLRTSAFEFDRLRLGRRTRDQVAALDWITGPGPILDELFIFGPRTEPLVE
jgi:uncharacterized protein (TIGR03083 family)